MRADSWSEQEGRERTERALMPLEGLASGLRKHERVEAKNRGERGGERVERGGAERQGWERSMKGTERRT